MATKVRTTRKHIALVLAYCVVAVILRALIPPELEDNNSALLTICVPSIIVGLVAFICEQGLNDHSERKHVTGKPEPDT